MFLWVAMVECQIPNFVGEEFWVSGGKFQMWREIYTPDGLFKVLLKPKWPKDFILGFQQIIFRSFPLMFSSIPFFLIPIENYMGIGQDLFHEIHVWYQLVICDWKSVKWVVWNVSAPGSENTYVLLEWFKWMSSLLAKCYYDWSQVCFAENDMRTTHEVNKGGS